MVRSDAQLLLAFNAPPRPEYERDAKGDSDRWKQLRRSWVAAWQGHAAPGDETPNADWKKWWSRANEQHGQLVKEARQRGLDAAKLQASSAAGSKREHDGQENEPPAGKRHAAEMPDDQPAVVSAGSEAGRASIGGSREERVPKAHAKPRGPVPKTASGEMCTWDGDAGCWRAGGLDGPVHEVVRNQLRVQRAEERADVRKRCDERATLLESLIIDSTILKAGPNRWYRGVLSYREGVLFDCDPNKWSQMAQAFIRRNMRSQPHLLLYGSSHSSWLRDSLIPSLQGYAKWLESVANCTDDMDVDALRASFHPEPLGMFDIMLECHPRPQLGVDADQDGAFAVMSGLSFGSVPGYFVWLSEAQADFYARLSIHRWDARFCIFDVARCKLEFSFHHMHPLYDTTREYVPEQDVEHIRRRTSPHEPWTFDERVESQRQDYMLSMFQRKHLSPAEAISLAAAAAQYVHANGEADGLVQTELVIGSRVTLFRLQDDDAQYNGQRGDLLHFIPEEDCCCVRLELGTCTVISVHSHNLLAQIALPFGADPEEGSESESDDAE